MAAKAAEHVDAAGRACMCRMALALVALSQGIPFFHAGDDLLRSKSLDRDSYNSGGWGCLVQCCGSQLCCLSQQRVRPQSWLASMRHVCFLFFC